MIQKSGWRRAEGFVCGSEYQVWRRSSCTPHTSYFSILSFGLSVEFCEEKKLQFKLWYTNLSLVKSMCLALVSYCTGFIYCTESKRVAIFCVKGVLQSLNLCMERS